ncbi:MAG TPA: lamin tail domain-containing protein [Acidimicrobiales bacterium]|nr:lamin tail domain-containing protein [Acidimicrobiales bacterium]
MKVRFSILLAGLVGASLLIAIPPASASSPDIVVSQIYGGGGSSGATFSNDYIELFNRGTTPIGLAGWSVQYASTTGTLWFVTSLSGLIPPGGYFLVQEAGATGGAFLPPPDATGSISMSATTGKVALSKSITPFSGTTPSGSSLADFVGYGTANAFEGTAPAPAPSVTNADFRRRGGCVDTDQNAADFSASAAIPRNSGSVHHSCPATVGDFDGNGTTDIAVFRPASGVWYVNGGVTTGWGTSGDIPVPGDYDGNGTTDIAVFRPDNGVWYVNGGITTGWGTSGDIPVPGDYDGNGTTDIAVFRPPSGVWYVNGGVTTGWGTNGDQPTPLPGAIRQFFFP